ncbi:MAG: transketolase [Dehalococcoidales bacterium]|nr:transketolase [Dehalococcoidales bacterium]
MSIDELCINTIRVLSMDAVQKANSGHPGAPMGMAPMAYVLWDRFLKHNPQNPLWINRDRFILSPGHASAMLYSLLHLTGYDLPFDELTKFRQWGSKTPGHPEHGWTPGAEATTGPLGQGFCNGIGMAIAERWLAQQYNRPGYNIIDHYTYAIVSDGDLMEGITSEAASLAGTLQLGKVIYLYDDNDISIEGSTDITFKEDVALRFKAYGWQVLGPLDGNDIQAINNAIRDAQNETRYPSLIICKTIIGCGSPNKQGKCSSHGQPLGVDEVALTRTNLNWQYSEPFKIPQEAINHFRKATDRGKTEQDKWQLLFDSYRVAYPDEYKHLMEDLSSELPQGWEEGLDNLFTDVTNTMATREASGQIINLIAPKIRNLVGGSADLAPSIKTTINDAESFSADCYSGRNFHFGIREHAMGAIANGMTLHGGLIPFVSTFLVFYDYMCAAVRLSAFMKQGVIYIYSHDSIGVGEDGPTHQPIEQLMGLRMVPDLVTIRPADATETVEAWRIAIKNRNNPTALVFTRQKLPVIDRQSTAPASGVRNGGYILWQSSHEPDIILIATGSEVHIALEAGRLLDEQGIASRVVSMPSWELFEAQSAEYRDSVLPRHIKARISIEAGLTFGWERYVGNDGIAIGIDRFGASAPYRVLYQQFGLTADRMVSEAHKLLKNNK